MTTKRYDIIIIGSGAGGGTLAHALASTPANILLVERGDFVPQERENWDPEAVWKHLRYQTTETWLDAAGEAFRPYTHYCVGGNTKFWGTVLYRLRREDFGELEHVDGVSPAWPIDYATLARSMGWYAEGPIENPNDLEPALARAKAVVKRGEPALVDVVTQPR